MRNKKRHRKQDHSLTAEKIKLATALVGLLTAIIKLLAKD